MPHRPGVDIGDRCLIEGVWPDHVPPVPRADLRLNCGPDSSLLTPRPRACPSPPPIGLHPPLNATRIPPRHLLPSVNQAAQGESPHFRFLMQNRVAINWVRGPKGERFRPASNPQRGTSNMRNTAVQLAVLTLSGRRRTPATAGQRQPGVAAAPPAISTTPKCRRFPSASQCRESQFGGNPVPPGPAA